VIEKSCFGFFLKLVEVYLMPFEVLNIFVETTSETDIIDLTPHVMTHLNKVEVGIGSLTLYIPGSTAALTTIEFESGVINDLKKAIERMAPEDLFYDHNEPYNFIIRCARWA